LASSFHTLNAVNPGPEEENVEIFIWHRKYDEMVKNPSHFCNYWCILAFGKAFFGSDTLFLRLKYS
jgi:hypothetical protein